MALSSAFPKILLAAACAVTLVGASGCGEEQSRGGTVPGDTLTVFSSLPLQGSRAEQSRSIVNAQKLALRDSGGRVGDFKVNYASADDSTAGGDRVGWDPDKTAENARKAVENTRTIAYIGELDSGATAISLPITNEAGFAQVSSGSTAVGLTKFLPGAEKGEPDKFYPSGTRTFARVVPADDVQASAAAGWTRSLGARRVFLLGDKSLEGDGLVELYRAVAPEVGLRIVGADRMDPRSDEYRDLARDVARTRPDAIYFGGAETSNALRLWRDLDEALPEALLIGSHQLLVPAFYERLGGAESRTYITSVAQHPSQLPPSGRRFVRDYTREFGERPDPLAAYGYAAMSMVLDALDRAADQAAERERVVEEVLDTTDLDSVIGRFSIDDNGDTSLERIAGYRVRNGRLVFAAPLRGRIGGS
ncbi:MAG: branched-chain amino acid ABC transporter substrate-binding protein [Solirubrobacterales bacterium]